MEKNVLRQQSIISKKIRISFHQLDPAGILFFGHVFSISHELYEDFITEYLGIEWKEWFQNKDWNVPIRHVDADYLRPLVGGEIYEGKIDLIKKGENSLAFKTTIGKDLQEYCVINTVHVFVDKHTNIKRPIPSELLYRLLNY